MVKKKIQTQNKIKPQHIHLSTTTLTSVVSHAQEKASSITRLLFLLQDTIPQQPLLPFELIKAVNTVFLFFFLESSKSTLFLYITTYLFLVSLTNVD